MGRDFACPKVKKTKKKEKKTLMNLKKKNSKRDLPPHRHLLVPYRKTIVLFTLTTTIDDVLLEFVT